MPFSNTQHMLSSVLVPGKRFVTASEWLPAYPVLSHCARQIFALILLSHMPHTVIGGKEHLPVHSRAAHRGPWGEGRKPASPTRPHHPLLSKPRFPQRFSVFVSFVPMGTWGTLGVFYQTQIELSSLFCGFFHHRNMLQLFLSTRCPSGPAQEDTLSIIAATKVTELLSPKDLPLSDYNTLSGDCPWHEASCSWTKSSLGLLNCATHQHFRIRAKIILPENHLSWLSGARECF